MATWTSSDSKNNLVKSGANPSSCSLYMDLSRTTSLLWHTLTHFRCSSRSKTWQLMAVTNHRRESPRKKQRTINCNKSSNERWLLTTVKSPTAKTKITRQLSRKPKEVTMTVQSASSQGRQNRWCHLLPRTAFFQRQQVSLHNRQLNQNLLHFWLNNKPMLAMRILMSSSLHFRKRPLLRLANMWIT